MLITMLLEVPTRLQEISVLRTAYWQSILTRVSLEGSLVEDGSYVRVVDVSTEKFVEFLREVASTEETKVCFLPTGGFLIGLI